ncbi:MAG TPA: TasA family protein [Candidatus Binatia bacterium]|nr:TasA family protein [Candidatus Binatia bacterium]
MNTMNTRGRRRLAALAIGLGLLGTFSAAMSLAVFTDQETVDGTFSTGSIVLDAAEIDALTLSVAALMPGDAVTDDVVVENDGTAQLRYAISTATTDPDGKGLRDALNVTIRTIDVTTPGTPCNDFDGTILYDGVMGAATAAVGSPAAGADAGDRTLAGLSNETLCFRVSLPLATGNAHAAATAVTTFTFDAEQTANNP